MLIPNVAASKAWQKRNCCVYNFYNGKGPFSRVSVGDGVWGVNLESRA